MKAPWNHNIHYHGLLLASVPPGCQQALDVGCGEGLLTRHLARLCTRITGIDSDARTLHTASENAAHEANLAFIRGDAMVYPFADASFDFIAAVATLHHLPLRPALLRLASLLKPGGVLAIVGLYRSTTLADGLWSAAGASASWFLKRSRNVTGQQAPMQQPTQTLAELRAASRELLPGCILKRRLLFRYSLIWHKPTA